MSGDGNLVSVSNDSIVRVYSLNSLTWEPYGNDLIGTGAILSSDGNRLALNDSGTTKVYTWDFTNWILLNDITEPLIDFASGGEHLITQSGTTTYKIYQLVNGSWVQKGGDISAIPIQYSNNIPISISSDGNTIATQNTNDITVFSWDNNTWQAKGTSINNTNGGLSSVSISGNGNSLAYGSYTWYIHSSSDDYIYIGRINVLDWDGQSWQNVLQDEHEEEASLFGSRIAFSADGHTLAVCNANFQFYSYYVTLASGKIDVYKKAAGTWSHHTSRTGNHREEFWGRQVDLSANGQHFISRNNQYARVFEIIPPLECTDTISNTSFEDDWGIWDNGCDVCHRDIADSLTAIGDYCIRIDNSLSGEPLTTNNLDLSSYQFATIDYSIAAHNLGSWEELLLEISYDGGTSFQIADYQAGYYVGFPGYIEGGVEYDGDLFSWRLYLTGPFSPSTKLRLNLNESDTPIVIYLDNIVITGCSAPPTCSDNIMNGDEIGIDCGGSCNDCNEIFVDQSNISGNNNGTSWAHAFTDLQDALAVGAGKTIHIAEGTYIPANTGRTTFFNIPDHTNIIGGYASGGGAQDPISYPTILSGDTNGDNIPNNNSYHVITINNVDSVKIEGIYIQDGYADDASSFARSRGGGIYSVGSTFSLKDVVFRNNNAIYGGGLFFKTSDETRVEGCSFFNNSAQDGSAIYSNNESFAYISQSSIQNNTASNRAAIEINNSSYTSIDNTLITNNISTHENALALIATNKEQVFNIYNSTIIGNSTDQELVLMETDGSNSLDANYYNTIIAHNNSDIQGSVNILDGGLINFNTEHCYLQETPVTGNHSNNFYADAGEMLNLGNDYKAISETSSIVNTGNNNHALAFSKDFEGMDRIRYIVDIGAFESSFGPLEIYVDETATGLANGNSWANAFTDLQDALALGLTNDTRVIYIAEGTYYPTSSNTTGSRGISFDIPNATTLLGGYSSGGGDRNHELYNTTLSGNIDGVSDYNGNSYHVVKLTDVSNVVFDGIIIRDGNANDPSSFGRARGGGLYIKNAILTLKDVEVKWNKAIYGGGLFARKSPYISIENSIFKKNTANYGSALYHSNETQMFIQYSRIIDNNSLNRCAIEVNNSLYTEISNSLIANNASVNANAIGFIATNRDQTCNIYNSTILGENNNKNLLTMQIGFNDVLDLNIQNSILAHQNLNFSNNVIAFNNGTLNLNTKYCYIQGSSIIGNSNNNLFSDTTGDLLLNEDYSPTPCSPIVDTGNNALTNNQTDINKDNRFYNTVDIGAFESQVDCNNPREAQVDLEQETFLHLYPNPTNGILYFQSNMENYFIFISDILGKKMLASENPTQLNLKDFPSGIYMLNIIHNGKVIQVKKIVKR